MKLNRIQYFQKICFAGLAVLFISLYCYGALEHSRRVNLDRDKIDQSAYLSYAQNMYETDYNYTGGRNRMPVYPFLLSLIYDPDFSENEYFTRGKYFNIALSAAILPALFLLLAASFPLRLAVNLWLIATFTVFIFRAAYVQVELLFYFLNFCSFLLMYKLLIRPSWQLGIISGAVIGLTHLTKASILPGLLLFILFFLGKEIYLFCTHLQTKKRDLSNILAEAKGYLVSNLLSLILVILCFTVTIYPYISNSNRFFGHYFYNVNSTFYMWYDSWQEAKQGTRLYGDGKGWPEMPTDLIPSPQKYLQEHTTGQIFERFLNGLDKIYSVTSQSYGYFKYAAIYLAMALIITCLNFRSSWAIAKKHCFLISFTLSYLIAYLLLYAWYIPIASGSRFVLAQFLPFMFFIASVLTVHAHHHPRINIFRFKFKWFNLFNALILGMILFEIYPILTYRIVTMFAGR